MSDPAYTPCTTCGACCSHYRVSFHWSEAEPSLGGSVPSALTEKMDAHRVAMKGTHCKQPRCIALEGKVGEDVRCTIYSQRSSSCREFSYAGEQGQAHDRCNEARAAHGLAALPVFIIPVIPQPNVYPPQLIEIQTVATPITASIVELNVIG